MSNVTLVLDADTKKAVQGFLRLDAVQQKVALSAGKAAKTHREWKEEAGGVSRATTRIAQAAESAALSYFGVSRAVQAAVAAFRELRQESEQSTAALKTNYSWMRNLAQVATDSKDLSGLIDQAFSLSSQTGLPPSEPGQMLFMGRSSPDKFTDKSAGSFAKLADFMGEEDDPRKIMRAVGSMTQFFGRKEVGTNEQLTNKMIAAGRVSPLTAGQIAAVIAPAMKVWSQNKWSDESLLAIMAKTATEETSAVMATELANFAVTARRELPDSGGSAMGAFEAFQAMPKSKREKILLGEKRFMRAYGAMEQNVPQINGALEEIRTAETLSGTDQSEIAKKIGIVRGVPIMETARRSAIATQQLDNVRRSIGERETGVQSSLAQLNAERIAQGVPGYSRAAHNYLERKFGENVSTLFDVNLSKDAIEEGGNQLLKSVTNVLRPDQQVLNVWQSIRQILESIRGDTATQAESGAMKADD